MVSSNTNANTTANSNTNRDGDANRIRKQICSGMYILCGEAMVSTGSGQILEASCLQAEIVKKSEHSEFKTISNFPKFV